MLKANNNISAKGAEICNKRVESINKKLGRNALEINNSYGIDDCIEITFDGGNEYPDASIAEASAYIFGMQRALGIGD